MTRWARWVRCSLAGALLAGCGLAAAQAPLTTTCDSSVLRAQFDGFGSTGRMPPELGRFLRDDAAQRVEPYKAFDNVYYVGICWVSAWLVTSPAGHVLIDSLYGAHADELLQNVRKLGLNPQDIRYVLITHGHFDHAGGASRLKAQLPNAHFGMTQEGWREAAESAAQSTGRPDAWTMIPPDIELADGQLVQLGGLAVKTYLTPGHTMGTASYSFDAMDGTKRYRAFTVGGLGLNAIRGPEQVEAFIASVKRIRTLLQDPADPVTVHLTTHPFSTGLTEAKDRLKTRKPGETHPLADPAGFHQQLDELQAGAEKRLQVERARKP